MDDTSVHAAHYVRIATVGDLVEARVLAARLDSEGIDVRVHSEALGPYPVTVGSLAQAELWVLSDRVDDANRILLDAEVNTALSPADPETPAPRGLPYEIRAVAFTVTAVLVLLWIVRFARAI
jgi:hypothetical protein